MTPSRPPLPAGLLALVVLAGSISCADAARQITAPELVAPEGGASLATQATGPDGTVLRLAVGNNQAGYPGTRLPQLVRIELKDNAGAPVANRSVSWSVGGGGSYSYRSTALTGADGRLDVYWTLGAALGAQTLDATVAGVGTVRADARSIPRGSRLHVAAGDSQTHQRGQWLPVVPAVALLDSTGAPVPGVTLSYQILSGGGLLQYPTRPTGVNGRASNGWKLGTPSDSVYLQTMRVALPGIDTVVFTARSFSYATVQLLAGSGQATLLGDSLRHRVQARVLDAHSGAPLSNVRVTWTSNNPGTKMEFAGATDANGYATGKATIGRNAGLDSILPSVVGQNSTPVYAVTTARTRRFTQVSVSGSAACGITSQKYLYCWGQRGMLGIGQMGSELIHTPQRVAVPATWKSVSVGEQRVCAITASDDAYCWGMNGAYGGYGDGSQVERAPTPRRVAGGLKWKQISAGYEHTCAISTGNQGYCWGWNPYGQLGTNQDELCPTNSVRCSDTPVAVSGGHSFAQISVGYHQTCGLTTAGAAYCWGSDGYGMLGDGVGETASCAGYSGVCAPVAVAGGRTYSAIGSGTFFACALTATEGRAYCWGSTGEGKIGRPANGCDGANGCYTPHLITQGESHSFSALSVGWDMACGLSAGGSAFCWGNNSQSALGSTSVGECQWATSCSFAPVAVSGGRTFTQIDARRGAVGVSATGVYGWGDNSYNQLGTQNRGTPSSSATPLRAYWVQ